MEATAEVSKTFNEKIRKYCDMTLLSCAYAGTGNVLKVGSPNPAWVPSKPPFTIADMLLSFRFKIYWVIVRNIWIKVKRTKVLL